MLGADDFATVPLLRCSRARSAGPCFRPPSVRALASAMGTAGARSRTPRGAGIRRSQHLSDRSGASAVILVFVAPDRGGRRGGLGGATLRERVWQRKEDRGSNLVEVHLSRLQEKSSEGRVRDRDGAPRRLPAAEVRVSPRSSGPGCRVALCQDADDLSVANPPGDVHELGFRITLSRWAGIHMMGPSCSPAMEYSTTANRVTPHAPMIVVSSWPIDLWIVL